MKDNYYSHITYHLQVLQLKFLLTRLSSSIPLHQKTTNYCYNIYLKIQRTYEDKNFQLNHHRRKRFHEQH